MKNRHKFPRFKAPLHIVAANDNHRSDGIPPKGPRPVSKLTDVELSNLEANFVAAGVEASQLYTLQDVRRERLRRSLKGLDGREVVGHIMALAATSHDYLTTYGALHACLWVNEPFVGHHSMGRTMKALGAAILYCVESGLPCMTTLVVDARDRQLSDRAAHNIYNEMKNLGQDVAANVDDYVLEQTLAAMDVVAKSQQPVAA